jgi:hypothetical protein
MNSDPNAETVGLAPKVAWIFLAVLGAAMLILLVDKLVVGDDVPDEVWLTLLATLVPLLGVGYAAPAALQRRRGVDAR